MAWIELHQTLREHKKMFACADSLNLSRIEMIGTLVSLWLWALDNAQDGSLEGVSDKTIARVCDFPEKKAGKLVEALHKHGFIDFDGEKYSIHDWFDYAGKLMERREKDRQRKRNPQNKKTEVQGNSNGIPAEVPGNSHATVPIPYHTVPNHKQEGNNTEVGTGLAAGTPPNDGSMFTVFWNAYPENARHRREEAWEAWKKLNPDREAAQSILDHLEAWKLSARWVDDNGAFVPAPVNFLAPDRGYMTTKPAPAKQAVPKGASGQLGAAELEAIRQVMGRPEDSL